MYSAAENVVDPQKQLQSRFSTQDYQELKASGLTDKQILKTGHFSIDNAKEAKRRTGINHRGLCFNYTNPSTQKPYLTSKGKPFYRIKPRDWEEMTNLDDDPPKYLSPGEEGNRPYFSKLITDFRRASKKTSITVDITEGEKKADCLAANDIFSIGLAGVYSWLDRTPRPGEQLPAADDSETEGRILPELVEALDWKGRKVNICFDSDITSKPQVKAAAKNLAIALTQLGAMPHLILLPNELDGSKNGVDDFIVRHGIEAYNTLRGLAKPALLGDRLNLPKDPNARNKCLMLWAILKEEWRYRPNVGWYNWTGKNWLLKTTDEFEVDVYGFQDAQDWDSFSGITLILKHLQARLLTPDNQWNSVNRIAFDNGTLDMETGSFQPGHNREDFITSVLPYDYNPAAKCPTWLNFLGQALEQDQDAIALLQAFIKWVLLPKPKNRKYDIEKSLDLVGAKGTGKGTTLDVITALVGADNVAAIGSETFRNPAFLANLLDKKVAIDSDSFGFLGNVGLFNKVVSNEIVQAKFLYKNAMDVRLSTVIVRAYNRFPEVPDGSEGLDRRIIALTFNHQPEKIDIELRGKLETELSGIFSWAWSVSPAEMKRRLLWAGQVRSVAKASVERFEYNNPEYCFLRDTFPTGHYSVKAGDLYKSYKDWCTDNGHGVKSHRKFAEAVQRLGCQSTGKSGGYYYYDIPTMQDFDVIKYLGINRDYQEQDNQTSCEGQSTGHSNPDTERVKDVCRPSEAKLSTIQNADPEVKQVELPIDLNKRTAPETTSNGLIEKQTVFYRGQKAVIDNILPLDDKVLLQIGRDFRVVAARELKPFLEEESEDLLETEKTNRQQAQLNKFADSISSKVAQLNTLVSDNQWEIGDRLNTPDGVIGEVVGAGNKYIKVRWANSGEVTGIAIASLPENVNRLPGGTDG